jgi:hypothetical protein
VDITPIPKPARMLHVRRLLFVLFLQFWPLYMLFSVTLAVGQAGSNGWHQFPLDLLHEIMLLAVLLKGCCTCRIPGADNKSSELKMAQIGHFHSIRGSGSWGA